METATELSRIEVEMPKNRYQSVLAWSPDGRRVLRGSEIFAGFTPNSEFKVWDVAAQQEILMRRGPMAG
jgi:hypothetical protein